LKQLAQEHEETNKPAGDSKFWQFPGLWINECFKKRKKEKKRKEKKNMYQETRKKKTSK